ncbi:eCIS core domain-containing protein, partial [Streptomyces sp. NPDC003860]
MHDHKSARDKRTGAGRTPPRASSPAPPHALLKLQGAAGNAAVVQMLRAAGHSWVQEKHEHSAGCGHQESGEGAAAVQRSAVHDVLRTPGRPLDATTRTDMEARLGADFSDVRIHSDGAARASAAEIGARAYTSGNHVVIGDGGGDRHTLAHELTHVIQQRQGPVAGADNGSGLKVSDPADRFEREAEANARRALSGQPPAVEAGAGPAPKSAPTAVQRLSRVQGSTLVKSGRAGWANGVDNHMTLATGNARCHT